METEPHDGLKKLLSSKQNEQPPQVFFDGFSDRVIARLEEPVPNLSPWRRASYGVDKVTMAAVSFGLIVGTLLWFGLGEGTELAGTEGTEPLEMVNSPSSVQAPTALVPSRNPVRPLTANGRYPWPSENADAKPMAPRMLLDEGVGLSVQPARANLKERTRPDKSATNQ